MVSVWGPSPRFREWMFSVEAPLLGIVGAPAGANYACHQLVGKASLFPLPPSKFCRIAAPRGSLRMISPVRGWLHYCC